MDQQDIKNIEDKKQAILEQIADCEKAIDLALSFDSAALDPLNKLKADLNEQLQKLEDQSKDEEHEDQEVPKDAPFCRVFLLSEVNQDDIKDEADPWDYLRSGYSGVLYVKGAQDNSLRRD